MADPTDALRRWLGMFCLAVSAGMLIWGQTVLKPHLDGVSFLVYWTLCFLFTMSAILIALVDLRAVRRRLRQERRDLVERTMKETAKPGEENEGRNRS
jgi:hypothetical protein